MLQKMKGVWRTLTAQSIQSARADKPVSHKSGEADYFGSARSWADDYHLGVAVSRQRYKVAFFSMMGLTALFALLIMVLVPLQHTELVVVHEGASGYHWITTTKPLERLPTSWARTRAEIAHYVRIRSAYDPLLYRQQSKEVADFSSTQINSEYIQAQTGENKTAPINVLGTKGFRTVIINSILPMDSVDKNIQNDKSHLNLAQVNYQVVDHLFGQSETITTPYSAVVSWTYRGVPSDPFTQMNNWDGFVMTKFTPAPINQSRG